MNRIDTVIFDVGGVLADYNPVTYFKALGYSDEMCNRLARVTTFSKDWKEYDRGVLTDEEIRNRFKKNDPEIAEEIDTALTHMHGLVTRRNAAIPWIESVKKKGIRTCVLSNFSYTVLQDNPEAVDFRFHVDNCFWSMEHKVIKPDDAAFLTLFYEFHINPENAVFIDDTEENLKAASKFNLHVILYQNQKQAEDELNHLLSD